MHYFAYGSLMDADEINKQMREGGGKVTAGAPARLEDHRLAFNKNSKKWGAGAANVVSEKVAVVEGVVYEIDDAGIAALDAREKQYDRKQVRVASGGQVIVAEVFVAQAEVIDDSLKPKREYIGLLLKGKAFLSEGYLKRLQETPTVD